MGAVGTSIRVRRASPKVWAICLSSPRMICHRAGSSSSKLLDLRGSLPLLRELVEDVVDLQLAEAVELGFQDGVGLGLGEPEPVDQLGRGVGLAVAVADDPDRLVEIVEDDREAFEDVDPLEQILQLEPQPARHDLQAEVEEMLEDPLQVEAAAGRPPRPRRPAAGTSG